MFDILEKLHERTSLTFEEANVTFKTTLSARQGGPESPILLTLFIDFVMIIFYGKNQTT